MDQGKQHIYSFPPLAVPESRILILGTMPGKLSLEKNQYYANPRNSFWPVMFTLFDTTDDGVYESRTAFLKHKGIALWDTVGRCERKSSADSEIAEPVFNDISGFLRTHTKIRAIFFNGAAAERFFHAGIQKIGLPDEISLRRLLSTSPANASYTFAEKLEDWRYILKFLK